MTVPKIMSVDEFRRIGLVQEINRQFLHPLGMALSVIIDDETGVTTGFGDIWDYRDDPEGLEYAADDIQSQDTYDKAAIVTVMQENARKRRTERLGYYVQPVPAGKP